MIYNKSDYKNYFVKLNELDKVMLSSLLKVEYDCLMMAYSLKPWLAVRPGIEWFTAKLSNSDAVNYHILLIDEVPRGYVYIELEDIYLNVHICPSNHPLRDHIIDVLLSYVRDQALVHRASIITLWLGYEYSLLHKMIMERISTPYYYSWYYRLYIARNNLLVIPPLKEYEIVYGGLELVDDFLETIHDAFGKELQWLDKREVRRWFNETNGIIAILYDRNESIAAGYFYSGLSLNGSENIGYIPLLGVKRKYWRKGYGRRLLYSILYYLLKQGISYTVLDCLEDLTEYYKRQGFKVAGRIVSINFSPLAL